MNNTYKLATVGATLLLAATGAYAQSTNGFYVTADGGAAFPDDTGIRSGSINSTTGDLHFDTGFRAGMEFGYKFTDCLAVELESGIIRNTINQIGIQQLSSVNASASLDQVPLLVNGILTVPIKGPIKPYIGLGAGAMAGIFSSSNIPGSYGFGQKPNYDDTDFTFAFQAEVGFKWVVCSHVDIGVAYKFIGSSDHSWHDNDINMKTDGTLTHTIEAALTWKF